MQNDKVLIRFDHECMYVGVCVISVCVVFARCVTDAAQNERDFGSREMRVASRCAILWSFVARSSFLLHILACGSEPYCELDVCVMCAI